MLNPKRLIKLTASLVVRACDIVHDAFYRFIGRPFPPRCIVLYYHSIPANDRQRFARQMDELLKVAEPISTTSPSPFQPGKRYVGVTFDDGFVSVKDNAAPELAKRRIPWTMFVPSGCLGKKPEWLRQAHPAAQNDRVMTPDELRSLAKDPLVTIGSHTVRHANLLEIGPERAQEELCRSKADLEQVLGTTVDQFSYPFGARNAALDQEAGKAGYRLLFSSDPSPAFQIKNQFVCGRFSVDPDMPLLEFRVKVLGAYRWLGNFLVLSSPWFCS